MTLIRQFFSVPFGYEVHFTNALFSTENELLKTLLTKDGKNQPRKTLFVIDSEVDKHHPLLQSQILNYAAHFSGVFDQKLQLLVLPGGEGVKNDTGALTHLLEAIDRFGICRHSYVLAIGGGALLDMAGFAAAIAHRGVRHIRIPTTVLSQNDSGVGVKNGINFFGKKNFLGAFKPPYAVINDFHFLETLHERDWRAGIGEAIKVALIKDRSFFEEIVKDASLLNERNLEAMQKQIIRCAEMHLAHIAGNGDPFEMGSSRPLDFGHWAAHKLEQLTHYEIRHGEAVAIGIALDVTYSYLKQMISEEEWNKILLLIKELGFELFIPELENKLDDPTQQDSLLHGLSEFREHLGGELTITLLEGIGKGTEVHEIDHSMMKKAVELLKIKEKERFSVTL